MTIWIDNDGCPQVVRDIVFKAATKRQINVAVVGNSYLRTPPSENIRMHVVSGSFDAADDFIVEHAQNKDLVITADILLASRVVEKGALAVSPRGDIYDPENIAERVTMRNLHMEMRSAGEIGGGPSPYSEQDKKRFANSFDRLVHQLTTNK